MTVAIKQAIRAERAKFMIVLQAEEEQKARKPIQVPLKRRDSWCKLICVYED